MPPVPSPALLRSLRSSLGSSSKQTYCNCTSSKPARPRARALKLPLNSRRASSYRSATAISASKSIPPNFKRLYDCLESIQKNAPSYVDLSRLQLALRGLESSKPAIRVAFLGLANFVAVRRLARVLLADPLDPPAEWEQRLGSLEWHDNRSLLLRYGDENDEVSSSAILAIQHVPSRVLQRHNVEILISTIPSADAALQAPDARLEDTALVPMVGTPMSFSGNVSLIRHPVHRALVLAEGLAGCMQMGRWTRYTQDLQTRDTPVKPILDICRSRFVEKNGEGLDPVSVIDLEQASQALDLIRQSKENAPQYAEGWKQSGISEAAGWISAASRNHPSGMSAAVYDLINDILIKSHVKLQEEQSERAAAVTSTSVEEIAAPLQTAVTEWVTKGHVELRDRIETAITSREWGKLRWWKLFWRVDDVGMILSQMVERSWLRTAERELIFLEGRFTEARLLATADSAKLSDMGSEASRDMGIIEFARSSLLSKTIPTLEALAQSLVLQTASLTTISSAFAVLLYLSAPTVTAVQAGAFAALGLTWSLRRMQRKWEDSRDAWIEELREEGRKSLRNTEDTLRLRIAKGPVAKSENNQSLEDLEVAEAAIDGARQALQLLDAANNAKPQT